MLGMSWASLLLAYAPWSIGLVGALYLGLRATRALESRGDSAEAFRTLKERTLKLEEEMTAMSERLEHVSASQEFTSRLLEERSRHSS